MKKTIALFSTISVLLLGMFVLTSWTSKSDSPEYVKCSRCGGTTYDPVRAKCPTCKGVGTLTHEHVCYDCGGEGYQIDRETGKKTTCFRCRGNKRVVQREPCYQCNGETTIPRKCTGCNGVGWVEK